MDKKTDAKEKAFQKVLFFSGIAIGAISGIFGNICASYLYEWNKDNLWFFVIATVGFLAAIGSVFRQMRHFSKRNTTETPTSEK
jgi:F0F1-type ATP synthase assembly protein I